MYKATLINFIPEFYAIIKDCGGKHYFHSDVCYINIKDIILKLSRSNLRRCLKRKGLNILPKTDKSQQEKKQKFT